MATSRFVSPLIGAWMRLWSDTSIVRSGQQHYYAEFITERMECLLCRPTGRAHGFERLCEEKFGNISANVRHKQRMTLE